MIIKLFLILVGDDEVIFKVLLYDVYGDVINFVIEIKLVLGKMCICNYSF